MTSFIFKKRHGQSNAANVQMTEAEAALAQSDFNIDKISEIENKFTGGVVLLVPGRIFIREGMLWKVCRKGLKKRQFFLFNDILVYGSIVANRYSNQHILPLSQMSVSAECLYQPATHAQFDGGGRDEQLDVAHAFQISHADKSFHVFAHSAPDKTNWLSNLEKHIARVSNREKVATRAVWVPDSHSKECMCCDQKFSAFVRKHHCRRCGRVVCTTCSPHRVNLRPAEGGGESKLERTCKECFKKMFKPMITAEGGEEPRKDPSSPPPASVAAQMVTNALRGRNQPSPVVSRAEASGKDRREEEGDSTETEDSDDSGNEEEVSKEEPSPPSATHTVGRSKSETRPRIEVREKQSEKPSNARPSSEHLEVLSAGKVEAEETPEAQPTPPPRKKKMQKQKMKQLQQQLAAEALATTMPNPPSSQEGKEVEQPKATSEETTSQTSDRPNEEEEEKVAGIGEPEEEREGDGGGKVGGESEEEKVEVTREEEEEGGTKEEEKGKEEEEGRGTKGEEKGKEEEEEVKPEPVSLPKEEDESASLQKKPRRRKKYLKREEQDSDQGAASTDVQARTETSEKTERTEQSGTGTAEQTGMETVVSEIRTGEQIGMETADKAENKVDIVGVESSSQGAEGQVKVEGGAETGPGENQQPQPSPEGGGATAVVTKTHTEGTPKGRPRGRRHKFKAPAT